jgi:hypothetical protein
LNKSSKKGVDWVHWIILPCTEVTRLLSAPSVRPLSRRKRVALRVHLVLCQWCSRYERQLKSLLLALHRHPSDAEAPDASRLSPEARERIRLSLRS